MTAQTFSQRPSRLLGILDPSVALDLDTAAAIAIEKHEREKREDLARRIAYQVGLMFSPKKPEFDDFD